MEISTPPTPAAARAAASHRPDNDRRPRASRAASWDRIARRHGPLLRSMAAEVLRAIGQRPDPCEVDDLVQEVFCRLLEAGGAFDPAAADPRRQRAYLRRVTRSVAVDRRRAAAAEKRGGRLRQVSVSAPPDDEGRAEEWPPLPDPAPGPEQTLLSRERWRLFLRRCRRAAGCTVHPGREAQAVALALVGGWTSRELAAASRDGLSPATIDSMICRLRRRLAAGGLTLPRRGGGRSRRAGE